MNTANAEAGERLLLIQSELGDYSMVYDIKLPTGKFHTTQSVNLSFQVFLCSNAAFSWICPPSLHPIPDHQACNLLNPDCRVS